ncbi:hypothetical protein XA68_16448 [Ophiocordyceps unilateralis]|uniref:Thioesterase domain-containing protein n=1 Tax=Ophiocordyceps unilateralis TaxID=268505 RepID=A0A2A9PLE7_OPHUN|nr:hypothetical protein XA68_16448 [Ophiocordyceps unilateralis]
MRNNDEPELVQAEDWACPDSSSGRTTPIFLIHDGGGTTFAYHCLEKLDRFVYGIPNPYFYCGSQFAGGLPEMGRLYGKRIRKAVARPEFPARRNPDGSVDVLLGGWSLGGFLSLEVAKELARDSVVRVVGILMVDSVFPIRPDGYQGVVVPLDTSEENKTKNQILSARCLAEAHRMVCAWEVPTCKQPKVVLVRATGYVPTGGEGNSVVDVYREDGMLGWEHHDKDMVDAVIDVEGHHFDIFAFERIPATTEAIQRGLDMLEGGRFLT